MENDKGFVLAEGIGGHPNALERLLAALGDRFPTSVLNRRTRHIRNIRLRTRLN